MGCNSSSVIPQEANIPDDSCAVKVRVNPCTPDQQDRHKVTNGKVVSPPTKKDINRNVKPKAPLAFEVPIFDSEGGSLIRKHPPKKLQRLIEDAPMEPSTELTHEELDERLKDAERRRREILSQRVMSAKTRPRPKMVNGDISPMSADSWERKM